jgi:D-amino-acid dehydrogenase
MNSSAVAVIGAGVVGASTAYVLARAGHEVLLLDAEQGAGLQASYANGAQLSYRYVEPFATPATLRALPSLLLMEGSPLRLRPRLDMQQWRWAVRFAAACRRRTADRTSAALLALAELSRKELAEAMQTSGLRCEHRVTGKLVLYPDAASLHRAAQQVQLQRALGADQQVLDRAECLSREPALAAVGHSIAGGVWTADEAVADAHALSRELADHACRLGATFRCSTQVTGFDVDAASARVTALRTAGGPIPVGRVVIACGHGASQLARPLGWRLPIQPLKGYSITLPIADPQRAPQVSVTDLRRKIVYAPLPGRLRVAGFVDMVGADGAIDTGRIHQLRQALAATFPGACDLQADPNAWAGLRPATPSSLPIVGPTRWNNVFLNVGHGALGLTLAMGSARLVAQTLAKQPIAPQLAALAWRG